MATITKRGNRYLARVRKGGVEQSKSFPNKVEAQLWAKKLEARIAHTQRGSKQSIIGLPLAELIHAYVDDVRQDNPWGRSKEAVLAMFVRDYGKVPVKSITKQWVLDFADKRRRDGAKPQTIAPEISYLGAVLEYGVDDRDLNINLEAFREAKRVLSKRRRISKSAQRNRRPTADELALITAYFRERERVPDVYADIVEFAALTAMRLGEICGLRWSDYSAAGRTILIRDRKHPTQKLGNDQTVPLLFGSHDIIERQPKRAPLIFPHNHKTVGTNFTRATRRLGIEDLHFHDLRHEGCSRMFEAGYQIQEVALVSGHRDWAQLKRYTQLKATDLHR